MDGTDRMLTLIVRNHELLRLAAETCGRSRETIAAAERAALMAVRHAVLCAAAAGSLGGCSAKPRPPSARLHHLALINALRFSAKRNPGEVTADCAK